MAKGSISRHKAKDGTITYRVRVSMVDPVTGKRRQPQKTFATRREAEACLVQWLAEIDRGEAVLPNRLSVAEFLEDWLATVSRHAAGRSTHARYRQHCRQELGPVLGETSLQSLTLERVQRAYGALLDAGYARSTVRAAHGTLALALDWAVERRLLSANPARKAARVLQKQRGEQDAEGGAEKCWPREEALRLLSVCAGYRHGIYFALLLTTGLRRGEGLGLRWADLDLPGDDQPGAAGRLYVAQAVGQTRTPPYYEVRPAKTKSARRHIPLSPPLCALLRRQRDHVAGLRAAAGSTWQEHDLVFPAPLGEPLPPAWLYHHWSKLLRECALPHLTLHGLRHTFATLTLLDGMPIPVVSRLLGHSSAAVTLRVYAHVVKSIEAETTERLTTLFWPADEAAGQLQPAS